MKNKLLTIFLALAASVGTLFAQSGTCGTNLTWTLDTESGILTISGTGAMDVYNNYYSYTPWYSYRESITSVIISNSVTTIGNYAFSGCTGLTSVTIPNSVTSIGDYAFNGCSKLTSVTIPNSVTSIRDYTFSNCYGLTSITIPNSVTSIGGYAFSYCTSLTSVTIGNSVTSIGSRAFRYCSRLTSLTIGESVTSIRADAFYNCTGLTSVIWNVKKYEDFSSSNTPFYYYNYSSTSDNFDLRKQITSFTFGDNVEYIPAYLCSGMSNLTSLTIPNSVTSIGDYAFNGCSSLTSVTIPNSVTSIGNYAFYDCSKITSDLNLNSVTSIGYYAFFNCSSLTSVGNLSSVTSIGTHAFQNCSSLTSITIPNSVTSIGSGAFNGCSKLTSITIPNSVTSIGEDAFYGCTSLTKVVIGDGATSIGQQAFFGCTYLEDITIGSGIDVDYGIGQNAFNGCRYLLSVTCKAVYPPVINANVFEGCGVLGGVDLYVPEKSVARYKKADVWSEFNIIGKDLSVDDPTNPTNPESGKYTITWQDEDGNVIKTDEVTQGTAPAFTGTTPTKEGYDFAGWLPNIKPAIKDMYYTTYFIPAQQQESKVYTVNINGENCSLNINNQYPEGTVITLEAVADECFEFQQWSDGNKDNPRTVTVTKDMSLTAEFNKVRYTVTGEPSTGGKVQIRKQ